METTTNSLRLFSVSGDKVASLLVTATGLRTSSKSFNDAAEFQASWDKTLSLQNKTEIAFEAIKTVSQEEGEDDVRIQYKAKLGLPGDRKMEFTDNDERDAFFQILENQGFRREVRTMTPLKAVLPYAFGLVITVAVAGLVYYTAAEIESGIFEDSEGNGRSARKARILAWVAEKLGTTGTLAIGGIITAYILYMIWKRYTSPPNQPVLEPQA
jgi:hypothetical protein